MRLLHIIVAIWIVLTVADCSQAKEWRGIVPLKSTRTDVERLLGPSTGLLSRYYLSDVTVDFQYSSCRCGDKCKDDDWNVPPGTVIVIRVGMKGVVKLADLKIDLTNFRKVPGDEDVPGQFSYVNEEEGFAIDTGGDYVSALTYGPRAKDDYLRCPGKREKYKPNCLPLPFPLLVECSSEVIKPGDTIECRVSLYAQDTPPVIKWSAPRGVSLRRDRAVSVKVRLAGRTRKRISITV